MRTRPITGCWPALGVFFSVFLVASLVGAPASAQNPDAWDAAIRERLRGLDSELSRRGYQSLGEYYTGALAHDDDESFALTLAPGTTYLLLGTCDLDCSDFDLIAHTKEGDEIAGDYSLDDSPRLYLRNDRATAWSIDVTVWMSQCDAAPCLWGVGVHRVGPEAMADYEAAMAAQTADAAPPPAPSTGGSGTGGRVERGVLGPGDDTLDSGEWVDRYEFEGYEGQVAILDLRSDEFDPYVMLLGDGEFRQENDDFQGSAQRSLIRIPLPTTTTYHVAVTTYAPGERGSYELSIQTEEAGDIAPTDRVEEGALTTDDSTLESGEYLDVYTFEGLAGQQVRIDLASNQFDPYLILKLPDDSQLENDDADDTTVSSRIETELPESGTYKVLATSYAVETGAYRLTIQLGDGVGGPVASSGGGGGTPPAPASNDVRTLTLGVPMSDALGPGDDRLQGGEWADRYVFQAESGQAIALEMSSQSLDTYLVMDMPDGTSISNDDHGEDVHRSRIDLVLPQTGRYRVLATSYAADEVGDYQLRLESSTHDAAFAASTGGAVPPRRIFGMMVGISDYEGDFSDLAYTDEDAIRLQGALVEGAGMQPDDSILLVDQDATLANLRSGLSSLSSRMSEEDLFVFFFSGHGDRVPRQGPQPADPDSLDETLEFYDGSLADDELSTLLDLVPARQILVVLDSCFSGGFSKDVISVPGRMGLFSSEEDTTSSVADKFQAGGFLAVFLADAMAGGGGDANGDGYVTALELSQYLHERYRSGVKSAPGPRTEAYVRTGGPQQGYQHLVVDRGSIGPFDPLFRLQSVN